MTAREIIKANIEYRCDDRVGMVFTNEAGRMNDFIGVGANYPTDHLPHWEDDKYLQVIDEYGGRPVMNQHATLLYAKT